MLVKQCIGMSVCESKGRIPSKCLNFTRTGIRKLHADSPLNWSELQAKSNAI